jgi:RHS repeat-associated protein
MKRVTRVLQTANDALSREVRYTYNDSTRTRTLVDPLGHTTTWTFDAMGRLSQRTDPGGRTESHTYGDRWNLTRVVTRRGHWIDMTYDAAGRMLTRYVPEAADQGVSGSDLVSFGYDASGQPELVTNNYSIIKRTYGRRGQLLWELQYVRSYNAPADSSSYYMQAVERGYRYDRAGRLRAMFVTRPKWARACVPVPDDPTCDGDWKPVYSDSIRYVYDRRGQLVSLINTTWRITASETQNTTWTYHYDANGRLDTLRVPLPTSTAPVSFGYDAGDRVRAYTVAGTLGGGREQEVVYEPDGSVGSTRNGSAYRYFTHDDFGQIRREGDGETTDERGRFTYDSAGNRKSDLTWTDYTYNSAGRLATRTAPGLGTETHSYDYAGNLRSVTHPEAGCKSASSPYYVRQMWYLADQRTSRSSRWRNVSGAGCQQEDREYWYDGLGRLVMVRSTNQYADDYGVTRFWWLGDEIAVRLTNPLSDPDLLLPKLKRNSSGTLEAFGEWYYPGPGTDNALGSFNYSSGGGAGTAHRHLFVRDWRGSVVKVIEHDGSGAMSQEYDAFGEAGGEVGKAGPGFNGAPSIDGFQYLRNRWYDPGTGRFTQEDPIGFAGGINLYAYAGSNPVSFTDPYGLKVCFSGSSSQVDSLKSAAQDATDTTFDLDDDNCATNVQARGDGFTAEGLEFSKMAAATDFAVTLSLSEGRASEATYAIWGVAVNIRASDVNRLQYPTTQDCRGTQPFRSLPPIVAHELGHAFQRALGGRMTDSGSLPIGWENAAHGRAGEDLRTCYLRAL